MVKKRVSIKDIAEKAGVSTALVSYVLNGKEKEARVGSEMAARVRAIAAEMNYQPNLIARGLKYGRTRTIGLIVADISNPFFAMLARNIELEAQKSGYTVLFGSSDEQLDKCRKLIDTFLSRQVDGLIITPVAGSQTQIRDLQEKGIKLVLMDRGFKDVAANEVVTNNRDAMYQAINVLTRRGYHEIGMIAYDTPLTHMQDRIQGYQDALKDAGIPFKAEWLKKVPFAHYKKHVDRAVKQLLKKGCAPQALVFATNSISVQALKLIHSKGIKIPEDLRIISFDESDSFDFFYTTITYVRQNLDEISKQSVQLLIRNMEAAACKPTKIIVPSSIVMGESSR